MKTIVSFQEISEFELKPAEAVSHWRDLVKRDIMQRWKDQSTWSRIDWPTGGIKDERPAFMLGNVAYVVNEICGSIYAPLRPSENDLWQWYRESNASEYWRRELLVISNENRRKKIYEPRSDWISEGISEYFPSAKSLLDISNNGRELINLVADKNKQIANITMAGMTADLEGLNTPIVSVRPTKLSKLPTLGLSDVVVATDILDRVSDLSMLISSIEKTIAPGGILFIMCPVSSGFEIQTLWGDSPSISFPDKLNIPSIKALRLLFSQPTWEILEFSTPGMFDVELVKRAINCEPQKPWPRVIRNFIQGLDGNGEQALTELLQSQLMSSFARLVIKKGK